jgi:cytochrome c peroxidase
MLLWLLMKKHPVYAELFRNAYPKDRLPITAYNIANAISSYIRTLTAMNSRFDQYINGVSTSLSEDEKKGFNLFTGKAKCATCHFVPLFNGLVPPQFTETESEVIGVPKKANKKVLDEDEGKSNFTRSEIHKFSFKTPTLRNIALTAPYMHNGAFRTLDEVLKFYNKGGGKGLKIAPANQTLPFDKLDLSKKEMKQVISFLKTLTDTTYTYNGNRAHMP